MKIKIATVVTCYKPKKTDIQNIKILSNIFNYVLVVCNYDENFKNYYNLNLLKKENIFFKVNNKNYGVAKAMNQGIDFFSKRKLVDWICFMDQDSTFINNPKDIIIKFLESNFPKNSIVGAKYTFDKKIKQKDDIVFIEKNKTIISGMFVPKKIFVDFKLNDQFFIDLCDHEYCKRLKNNNIKIFTTKEPFLLHNLGEKHILNFPLNIFKKYYNDHSNIRHFLMARNRFFLQDTFLFKNKLQIIKKELKKILKIIFFEKNAKSKIRARLLGFYNGYKKINFESLDEIKKRYF